LEDDLGKRKSDARKSDAGFCDDHDDHEGKYKNDYLDKESKLHRDSIRICAGDLEEALTL